MEKCCGRKKIKASNHKWYIEKNKSPTFYLCCEVCYNQYIKGTKDETNYKESAFSTEANCDYMMYKTDCNFTDCAFIVNNIRISVIDDMGNRYKKSTMDDKTFIIPNKKSYSIIIENLNEVDNKQIPNTRIALEGFKINGGQFNLGKLTDFMQYVIEAQITLQEDNNSSEIENDIIILKVNRYERLDTLPIMELKEKENGIFYNDSLPLIKLQTDKDFKYKAFTSIDIYKTIGPPTDFCFYVNRTKGIIEDMNDVEMTVSI